MKFNEDSRVKIPSILHLTRLGYDYLPDSKLMEVFYEKVHPIHSQIQKNLEQNQKLAELRDWLLPMLMNGQVRVN